MTETQVTKKLNVKKEALRKEEEKQKKKVNAKIATLKKEIADLEIKRQSEIFKEYGFESIEDLENFQKQNKGN
jgi:hypothetical protein